MSLTTTQKIVSNCRSFLDIKANQIQFVENENNNQKLKEQVKNETPNINAFDLASVLSIGLCNDNIIEAITFEKASGIHDIDQPIYNMVLNNLTSLFEKNKEIKKDIQKARSDKKIKLLKKSLVEIEPFTMFQVLAIAFKKTPEETLIDFTALSQKNKANA